MKLKTFFRGETGGCILVGGMTMKVTLDGIVSNSGNPIPCFKGVPESDRSVTYTKGLCNLSWKVVFWLPTPSKKRPKKVHLLNLPKTGENSWFYKHLVRSLRLRCFEKVFATYFERPFYGYLALLGQAKKVNFRDLPITSENR